jgi:hypothetical protein
MLTENVDLNLKQIKIKSGKSFKIRISIVCIVYLI